MGDGDVNRPAIIADSITQLDAESRDRIVICGSHGGDYVARVALALGVRGLVINDAGIGRDRAGVTGLDLLDRYGLPAAAVSHLSAFIGDGADCARRGRISVANAAARRLGVDVGQDAAEATRRMARSLAMANAVELEIVETRRVLTLADGTRVAIVDSASLIGSGDDGSVAVTGSHGALVGGVPASAIRANVRAAVFNDAGGGIDDAGFSRLPVLDARAIPAATVSAWSARIGSGVSTLEDGIVSRVNETAAGLGCEAGSNVRDFVCRVLATCWEVRT